MADSTKDSNMPGVQKSAISSYLENTAQVSTSVRALSLSLIAVTWLFLGGTKDQTSRLIGDTQVDLRLGMLLAILALSVDLLQYAVSAALSQRFADSLDIVIYEAERPEGDHESSRHWKRLKRFGFAEDLIRAAYKGQESDYPQPCKQIDEAKRIMTSAIPKPTADRSDRDKRVIEFLDNDWNPRTAVWLTTSLFWGKVCLLVVSALSVAHFIIFPENPRGTGELESTLRSKPSLESVSSDYTGSVRQIADKIAALVPGASWQPGPVISLPCSGDYAKTRGKAIFTEANFSTAIPDTEWATALDIIKEGARNYGATNLVTIVNDPGNREVYVSGDNGVLFRFDSHKTSRLTATSDCRLSQANITATPPP